MALVQKTIEDRIEALLTSTADMKLEDARTQFKVQLTQIIMDAIKSATVTVKPGVIQVTGSSGPASNAAPIAITESIT